MFCAAISSAYGKMCRMVIICHTVCKRPGITALMSAEIHMEWQGEGRMLQDVNVVLVSFMPLVLVKWVA